MIHVGDRALVFNETLVLFDDEVARFKVDVGGEAIPVAIQFKVETKKEERIAWVVEGGVLKIDFFGWLDALGSAPAKPIKLGQNAYGTLLGFMVAHRKIGERVNVVTLQFYTGGTYE